MTAEQPALRRPAPERGVFETMLVRAGVPVELDRHLARLSASVDELFGEPLPAELPTVASDAARGLELGRLRITLVPTDDGLAPELRTAAVERPLVFPAWEQAAALRRLVVPGGLGRHKWADRDLVDEAEQRLGGALALLVDEDGTVLEASRGNVFLVAGRTIVTPPADGRILPGVTRAQVLELASGLGIEAREEEVTLEQLAAADEVFLTGAIRGVEPVHELVDVRRWSPGTQTRALADRLWTLWFGAAPSPA